MIYDKFVRHIYFPLTQYLKGESIIRYLAILKSHENLSIEELQDFQFKRLQTILQDAYHNVPYYRAIFDQIGSRPEDIRTPQDFAQLPFLTKETIRDNLSRLTNPYYRGKVYPCQTSGSTGIPLRFFVTPEYDSWDWASRWRARNWFGIQIGDPEVAIWGRPLYSRIRRTIDCLKAWIRNTLLISGFEYSEEMLARYASQIRRFNPVYIYGYSNSIYRLALYFQQQKLPIPKRLKAIFVTAESLLPHERAVVEATMGVPIANEYGCSELGGFAYECPAGRWHVAIENVFLEFITMDNGFREIVGTSLTNFYQPFIRYRIGDLGDWTEEQCPCGCKLPTMRLQTGKVTDVVILEDRKIYSSEIFDYLNLAILKLGRRPFDQFQIIQTKPGAFLINYIPSREFAASDLEVFSQLFLNTVKSENVYLEYQQVSTIKPDDTGKIRYFISRIESDTSLSPHDV